MNSALKEKLLTWAMPVALACVLIVLAVLQYRWSREVSEAARTRMQASLQMSLMNLRVDLSRELAAMCIDLQRNSEAPADAKSLSEKLQRWQQTATHPGLVARVYLWQSPDGNPGTDNSSLLSLAGSRFETVLWPARLRELHDSLLSGFGRDLGPDVGRAMHFPANGTRPFSSPQQGGIPFPGLIDESIPALAFPAARSNVIQPRGRSASHWLIAELDAAALRERVFPDLAERYFGDPRNSEFEVAIVGGSRENPVVLYSSYAGFGGHGAESGDGSLNLFGPPNPRIPAQSTTYFIRSPGPTQAMGGPAAFSRPGGDNFGPVRFEPIRSGPEAMDWRVVVQSRRGSLEAAAAALRRRNLAFGFGVLLVLGATMGLILFTSQRARRLATMQMEFVAGVSHELRTPLAAILSAAENIADGVVENKQQLARYGSVIKNHARQLDHLVEQVLRFASVQRNKTPDYNLRPLQVDEAIEQALEKTASMIRSAEFAVELHLEPHLPEVAADRDAVSQCLENLITNAIKYSGESKWMAIRTGRGASAEEVVITVEDRGIGISHEEMEQIFEPFYRSPAVSSSQIHGTGLGLALARSFAEAMGGQLTVASKAGQGSSFTVHLPIAIGAEEAEPGHIEVSTSHNLPQART